MKPSIQFLAKELKERCGYVSKLDALKYISIRFGIQDTNDVIAAYNLAYDK